MILHGGMFFVKIKNRFFVEGWEFIFITGSSWRGGSDSHQFSVEGCSL